MKNNCELLKQTYESIALSGDERTTACDHHLRDLEIQHALEYIRDGDRVLDVGCGPGVALRHYASTRKIEAFGVDYANNMIALAKKLVIDTSSHLKIQFQVASVLELPFENNHFDVITSHRCLMALLDWNLQQRALTEIHRVLKPGGQLILMEGTFDGLERLNFYRQKFNLSEIEPDGRERLMTLKFREKILIDFLLPYYELVRTQRFGMYYFLTRIVQPLLVLPEQPSYNHKLNEIAKAIATERAEYYLTKLGLWDKRLQPARMLSGGMKRRLMIARALVHEPKMLILDEPTAGVDIELRRSMWAFLREINSEGTTVILTTHYLEEAEMLCRGIAIIDRGSIIEKTTVKELLSRLNTETMILDLKRPLAELPSLPECETTLVDEITLEVTFPKKISLNTVFKKLTEQEIEIMSMRNKTNRLEELFVRLTQRTLS